MQKKAAIQLSLSFIVMMVIAITVFIFSLNFLAGFFTQAEDLKQGMDQQTRVQIEQMLAGNSRIAIPFEKKDVKRGESVSFGVGIKNTVTDTYFKAFVDGSTYIPPGGDDAQPLSCQGNGECTLPGEGVVINYIVSGRGEMQIKQNNNHELLVVFSSISAAPRGHYIFNFDICSDEAVYPSVCDGRNRYGDSVNKLHVILS